MKNITIGQIGPDWKQTASARYYAERGDGDEYAFGMTVTEALENLQKREAAVAKNFDIEVAEEIAFLALGAAEYLRDHKDHDLSKFGGYMGFISEVVQQAPVLTTRWQKIQGNFDGVWLYDITERFGREWAEALLENETDNSAEFLEYIIADEMQKWDACQ